MDVADYASAAGKKLLLRIPFKGPPLWASGGVGQLTAFLSGSVQEVSLIAFPALALSPVLSLHPCS